MIARMERWMGAAAATALVLLMLVVLVDVIGRNFFNSPLASGTELTELLLASLAFLSFPLLAYRQRDITVDLLDLMAGERLRRYQVALAGLVGATVFGLLAWQLVVFARRAARSGEATAQLKVPLQYAWWSMSVLAAVTSLAALVVAVSAFTRHPVTPSQPVAFD